MDFRVDVIVYGKSWRVSSRICTKLAHDRSILWDSSYLHDVESFFVDAVCLPGFFPCSIGSSTILKSRVGEQFTGTGRASFLSCRGQFEVAQAALTSVCSRAFQVDLWHFQCLAARAVADGASAVFRRTRGDGRGIRVARFRESQSAGCAVISASGSVSASEGRWRSDSQGRSS